jgi:hypothetical protein
MRAVDWFYVLGGLWEAILAASLAFVLYHASQTKYRLLALAALFIAVCEGLQVGVCQAILGEKNTPAGMDTCDYVTGLPVGATFLATYLAAVLWALWKSREQQ